MLDKTICIRCARRCFSQMVGFAPPSERMGLVDKLMTMGFLEPWRRALVACCPTNVSPNPVGYTGVAMVENKPPEWCPHGPEHENWKVLP